MKLSVASCAILVTFLVHHSSQYIEKAIEDDSLCSLIKRRKIRLNKGSSSALIVKQHQLNNHSGDWINNMICNFQISPNTGFDGVIAVIQKIKFRKFPTDKCLDYVQFSNRAGVSDAKFCGSLNATVSMDTNVIEDEGKIIPDVAFVSEGDIYVTIFVSKFKLLRHEKMDLKIVFTAYKHCSHVFKSDTTYMPCSNKRKEFCIYQDFFMDTYINCPLADCVDEHGCSKLEVIGCQDVESCMMPDIIGGNKYGNKVLIGALSSVCILFALFILCLWICKTYKIFCWSQDFANPSSPSPQSDAGETPRVIEMNDQAGSGSPPAQGSTANQVDEDKDLPPSYDSLFPQR